MIALILLLIPSTFADTIIDYDDLFYEDEGLYLKCPYYSNKLECNSILGCIWSEEYNCIYTEWIDKL